MLFRSVAQNLSEAVKNGDWRAVDSDVHILIQQCNTLRAFTAFVARINNYERAI